ncbi:MAG TPA: STAS domain-containing protein [Gemmataceae bacterium]|jgi:anti-anti-sigma factor
MPAKETVVLVEHSTLEKLALMEIRGRVILVFSRLDFISSTGLGIVISLHKRLQTEGGELVLRDMNPEILEVFQITKLHTFLKIEFPGQ